MPRKTRVVIPGIAHHAMAYPPWDDLWPSARRHVKKPVKKYIKVTDTRLIDQERRETCLLNPDFMMDEMIRKASKKGIALANENFIDFWENRLECSLKLLKPGRRPKINKKGAAPY